MTEFDVDQLLKILPKLIRENDTVKGAIISALSGIIATRDDILELTRMIDKRFEAVDRRFEAADKRFEAVDRRFEAADKRFEELITAMNKHFETIDNSLKILSLSVARIESKEGILFHQTVLDLMKNTLQLENILPEKIRKEVISDLKGEIFFPGYTTDIDVLIENTNTYLVEVKSTAGSEDITQFLQNAKLFKKVSGKQPTQLILITLRINQATYNLARSQKIHVIAGEIL